MGNTRSYTHSSVSLQTLPNTFTPSRLPALNTLTLYLSLSSLLRYAPGITTAPTLSLSLSLTVSSHAPRRRARSVGDGRRRGSFRRIPRLHYAAARTPPLRPLRDIRGRSHLCSPLLLPPTLQPLQGQPPLRSPHSHLHQGDRGDRSG